MNKIKQRLIGGLTGILLAGATLIPLKAQERFIIDNFSQPNDTTLNYYGSGDVNKDNVVDWNDYNLMHSGTQNDMSDIDGDGISSTLQDQQTLENYLNENINYLPSHWNRLNQTEKVNWFEKMVEIDKTDTENFQFCYEFSNPFRINFHGFKSLEGVDPNNFPWKFSKNNRFNIPVYSVGTRATNGEAHSINCVLIGNNPFDFNDWYFIEPQTDKKVNPGDWDMANNNHVIIDYLLDMHLDGGGSPIDIIRWNLDEHGNPTLQETSYIKHSIPSDPNKDINSPQIDLISPIDSVFYNSNVNLEYLVNEGQTFLDSAYYELNGIRKYIPCEIPATFIVNAPVNSISGTILLTSQEGEYDFTIYADDMAKPKNKKTENIKFFIDKTAPTTSDNISEEWTNKDVNVVLNPSDSFSGVVSTKYIINSTNTGIPNIDYTSPVLISEEGEKYYRHSSTDKAGNSQNIVSKKIKIDKTAPEITASINHIEGTDSAEVAINVSEANPNYARYSYNGSDWNYFSSDTLFKDKLKQGENTLNVEAKDKATNVSGKEERLNFVSDAVEDISRNKLQIYPNPVADILRFKERENVEVGIYDISGRQLEKRLIEGNEMNMGNYKPGVYILKAKDSKGEIYTGKIIKK